MPNVTAVGEKVFDMNPAPVSMKALVFRGPNDIALEEREIPQPGFERL